MQTMEELIQSDPQTNINNEDDDEIYEKIEAPKFVDFTDPNPPLVLDDRSWFCLRVGCDLKHEEDMDPDAVYKRFVLRVMAARSPNLRLRKALLNKQAPSATLKCPLTAPAKSSKPRVSRMTAITNLSQKMADAKVKLHPISKLNLVTPHGKARQISVASKYLTTPRYKKCIPSRDPFRSVQNPKNTTAMPRGRLVAKALVFNSPKKTQKRKTSLECQTPVTEVCSEMKKLEISSQPKKTQKRKASLECQTPVTEVCSLMKKLEISKAKKSGKPSSSILRGLTTCPTASEAKKSKLYTHNQKSRVEIPRDHKDQEAKSSRRPKRKSKEKIRKVQCAGPQENPDNDSSDMEIDEKSRNGSMDVCSKVDSSNSKEERLVSIAENLGAATITQEENFTSSSETSLNGENRQTVSTDATTGKCPSSVSTSEVNLEEKDPHKFETLDGVKSESNEHEESTKSNIEEDRLEPANTTGSESEAIFSDDKENALASEVIFTETEDREPNLNCDNSQVKNHAHDSHDQKVNGAVTKTLKGSCNVAVTGSLGGKYKKAKPTNPKPFRLRTDERGVLREAKLLAAPLREIAPVSKVPDGGDPQRKHGNDEIQDLKSHGQCKNENDSQEGNQAEPDKIIQKIRPRQTPSYLKALKRATEPKMSTTTIQGQKNKLVDGKDKAAKRLESRTTAKSPLLRQQLVKSHQRVVRTRNATVTLVTPGGLGVIKESSTTVLRPKEARPEVCGTTPTSIPTTHTSNAGAAGRSTSRGKRPLTIPKEPNFHKIHTPKSCSKTPTKVIS